ncbi:MAG: hypothetical protein HRT63_12610 [Erythrobacter sp.]|nr:hypothetical protein [Erythrobacter sp.]
MNVNFGAGERCCGLWLRFVRINGGDEMRKRSTAEQWRRLLAEKEESGQTIAAFCAERDLGVHQYSYWRKRLCEDAEEGFAELKLNTEEDSGVVLDLRTLTVRLRRGFDAKVLQDLVRAVQC